MVSKKALKEWLMKELKKPEKAKDDDIEIITKETSAPAEPVASTSKIPADDQDAVMAVSQPGTPTPPLPSTNGTHASTSKQTLDNSSVVCVHGRMHPSKIKECKQMNQVCRTYQIIATLRAMLGCCVRA